MKMAHFEKYKGSNAYILIDHDNRGNTHGKENIDETKSHLNYNLCNVKDEKEYLRSLVEKAKLTGAVIRDDSNLICSVVITLPKDFTDNEELERQFFKGCYKMIADDFEESNIVSAWVHKDEKQPHIHIKFAPIREKTRTYKDGTTKKKICFDAKNCVNRNYLQQFHNRLDTFMEDWLGFKTSVHTGITKAQGGNKTIQELKAISAELEKTRDIIENSPQLILAEQKMILNEYWQEYKEVSNVYWQEYKAKKQQIKDELWELKKGVWGNEKQLKRDLDFIENLNRKGFLSALFSLITALFVFTRKNTLKDKQKELEAKLSELEKARQSISNYQHNAKEYLKKKDFERIEIALDKWETAVLRTNEEIRDLFRNNEKIENRGISERNREDIEEL